MQLSVIIVNYNVRYFLEQCLHSVRRAAAGLAVETIVVDNHSTDGSLAYLQPRFPEVRFIVNEANEGFGRACNRGLASASGDYILFLNPDTLVAEDSFSACLRFFEAHPEAGALGVRMLDGSGQFLKESKRSFPSPLTSLFKLFGLAALFPRSKVFSRYHLGHLRPDQNHEVDVLAGAYMLIRHDLLRQHGGFDETFFMYGEDVDLSYRMQQAGYRNFYLADTTIIHFKGESTKRGSLNYVRMFYTAMSVFVRKHYGGTRAGLFTASIHLAIWFRAAITAGTRFLRWIGLPLVDALLILLSFFLVKELWSGYVRTDLVYPEKLLRYAFPAFTLAYLAVAYYAGLYDRYYKVTNLVRATVIATVALLAIYALLPEELRFSRAIVVLGAALTMLLINLLRWMLVSAGVLYRAVERRSRPYLLIVASKKEYEEARSFLHRKGFSQKIIGRVAVNAPEPDAVATLADLPQHIRALHAEEVVFCAGALSYKNIIREVDALRGRLKMRFHAAGSESIVGSDASTASGEIVASEGSYHLHKAHYRRVKRLIDGLLALALLLTFPLHLLLNRRPLRLLANCLAVLFARKTWVGYVSGKGHLPRLRPAVLGSNGLPVQEQPALPEATRHKLDHWYALDYEPLQDVRTVLASYRYLGAKS